MAPTRKLFIAAALLGISLAPFGMPQAEAVASCTDRYCVLRPSSTICACPAGSAHPYQRVTCGTAYTCDF
jgi:hypothetical protein